MKGILCKEEIWLIKTEDSQMPVHPTQCKKLDEIFTKNLVKEVEYEIVDEYARIKTQNNFGWQKCPLCNGIGIYNYGTHSSIPTCPTCNGKRIINIQTGKPPKE